VTWGAIHIMAQSAASAEQEAASVEAHDHYYYVADDILEYCKPRKGVWVDLGAGTGSVAFAVAAKNHATAQESTFVLLDPDREALGTALDRAKAAGLAHRIVAVVGKAEKMPLPSESVDLVFSRGSIFFWDDPAKGIKEVYRVLRPGGEAMIGGGKGSKNPQLAAAEPDIEVKDEQDVDLSKLSDFARVRHPKTFRKWAEDAGIPEFEVVGRGSSSKVKHHGGIWLRFTKPMTR
jgi:SAM-dependent methyltransferase